MAGTPRNRSLLAWTLLVAAALFAPVAAESRPWTMADVGAIEALDDVRLAPGGGVALVHYFGATDLAKNTVADDYRLVQTADGSFRKMPEGLDHPRWSPGGTAIAWLRAARNGSVNLVLTDAGGNSLHALTLAKRAVVDFTWSPDGKHIAAIETTPAKQVARPRFRWMSAESDYLDTSPPKREVYVIDARTGEQRLLTHDSWSYGGPVTDHDPSWSANGAELALVRQPSPLYGDFEHAQYVALSLNGTIRQLLDSPFFAYPDSIAPQFAPDGDAVAYTHTWDGLLPSREDVYVGDADVSAPLDRDAWSCGAGRVQWQQGTLLADMMDGVTMRLYRLDPQGGAPQALTEPGQTVESFSTAGARIAYVGTSPEAAPEIFVLDPGKAPHQVTHFGDLHGLPVMQTRYVEWQSTDGRAIHGQLTLPATGLADAPLVVEPHGGPQCADDSSFNPLAQFLASNGYAYFRPDPRGSDGYGDWSYKAIVGNWGEGPMSDDMAGVDAVLASGVSRPDRLYIEGGSYGGYLTTWIVAHSNRFKAAVAAVPVTNLLLDYTLSESPNITKRFFGAKPTTDQTTMLRESPLTYASDVHTPLLVEIGLRDTRAPYAQAIEFFKAVGEAGDETQLMADADAGHGPSDPQGFVRWTQETYAWFAKHGAPPIPGMTSQR